MRWSGVIPVASVSPLVNTTRVSLTSGEGDVRVPSFRRFYIAENWPNAAQEGRCGSCSQAEIEIYPLQKGVIKGINSLMGCNSLAVVVVSMGGLKSRQSEV